MTLSVDTLATELEGMVPEMEEQDAINNFATAFENYFFESVVNRVAILDKAVLTPATTALRGAMVGLSETGSASIANGIIAFWAAIPAIASTVWVLVPPLTSVTPPTTLAGLATAIEATGQANMAGSLSLEDSAKAMATTIHGLVQGGIAIVTVTPPVSFPIL